MLGDDIERKLDLKENEKKAVYVKDLNIITVSNVAQIAKLMEKGMSVRKVGSTAMNETSSRSHSIFTIYIETSEDVSLTQAGVTHSIVTRWQRWNRITVQDRKVESGGSGRL